MTKEEINEINGKCPDNQDFFDLLQEVESEIRPESANYE